MSAAGEKRKARRRLRLGFGLGKDASAHGDNRVGRKHGGIGTTGRNSGRFGRGKAHGKRARGFLRERGFVDVGRRDGGGDNADLRQQSQAARACRRKDERRRQRAPT
jgi:hypothetical protein